MNNFLQTQIRQRMENKNLTVRGLEKKAGLGQNSVRSILEGISKNPRTKVLLAIADVLECSLTDLLEKENKNSSLSNPSPSSLSSYKWDLDLYIQSCQTVNEYIDQHNMTLSTEKVIKAILDVYEFSFKSDPPEVDPKFCSWLLERIE